MPSDPFRFRDGFGTSSRLRLADSSPNFRRVESPGEIRTSTVYKAHALAASVGALILVAILGWCLVLAVLVARRLLDQRELHTRRLLIVLCESYLDGLEKGTKPSVQALLAEIDAASVERCWRTEAGTHVDAWGHEVAIEAENSGGGYSVVGRSRGPDGVTPTPDDVVIRVPRED